MKAFYLLFILLITSAVINDCYAQTHYDNLKAAEKQRAIDNQRQNESLRQNLENNRPVERQNSTTTNSTTSNANAEAERIAQEKYNEKLLKEREEIRKSQYRTPDQAYNEFIAKNNAANEKLVLQTYIDLLTKAGFHQIEIFSIRDKYKSALVDNIEYGNVTKKDFFRDLDYLQRIKDNYLTASFEDLKSDVESLMNIRTYCSAHDCIDLIENRFTDKKEAIFGLKKDFFKSYFWHQASYGDMSDASKKKLIDDYFLFEEANPTFYNELHDFLKGKLGMSPYKIVKSHYKDKLDCNICSYSGKEKREYKDAIEKYTSREAAVIKNTFKGYYREDSPKGKISYFNSDKVEITIEEFMIHQVELNYKDDFRFEPNMTLDLIQKLATIKKVEPVAFITDFLRIEPKDKFELLLKMAENNDYQAMRSAYQQEKDERYKDINTSYHLKDKWYDFFATKAVEGDVEAMKMLYQAYKDYNQKLYNNKNTSHPKHFEKTFIAFEGRASEDDVFDFSKYLAIEFYDRYLYNTKFSYEYLQKIKSMGVKTIFKLAEKGNTKAIDLLNDLKKMENNE